jgi:predicted Zn-dependent protease
VVLLIGVGVAAKADLPRWIQDIPSPSQLQAVFFRAMALPGGPVEVRRPPKETRPELAKMIAGAPTQADLYALRAHEDELSLDFAAAESDWKKYAELSKDNWTLADYYHRRIQSREEIAALELVGKGPGERFQPVAQQLPWKAYQRILSTIDEQALPPEQAVTAYRAWVARYPGEGAAYKQFFQAMVAKKNAAEARTVLAEYRRAFASDAVFPIQAEASLAPDALSVYDRSFQPLWPAELITSYFDLLKEKHQLRTFLERARAQIAANPQDIAPVARVYHYYVAQKNDAGALRVLYEYRQRKQTWNATDAWTLGWLFEDAHNYDEAARAYHALYVVGGADNQRRALAAIARLLLAGPEQPVHFGSGDLSYYRDIATMDSGPGYLNGVLSLIFNTTSPQYQYDTENQASAAYFHRAKASELIAQIDQRYPDAPERPALHERLIAAYVTYGDSDGVIRAGRAFRTAFPKAPERTGVALAMADAYARQDKTTEEFATYDELLKELGASAENMPLGGSALARLATEGEQQQRPGARSAEYARVLDRYIGRLVAMKKLTQALAVYRGEIDRNPNDPGLYERLAGFLDQNKMGLELEQTYRKAMTQFQDKTWSHKLARWYLRQKQVGQFDILTRDVVKVFSGTELESYLANVSQGNTLAPALYRQVNLYAHQRFPNDLTFTRNLLGAYDAKATADPVAREKLLRAYWYYAPDLRDQFFELLARTGKLKAELAAIQKPDASSNPAAARLAAEGEAWQSHFEAAAPLFRAVAAEYPGEVEAQARAASMYRSLATYDAPGNAKDLELAASLEENVVKFAPRDSGALATVGDIYADRELYNKARPFWNRIAAIAPGQADGYIEAATVYWDYYRFDDALRFIDDARKRLNQPQLYSYEAGAIYENRRDYARAVDEYSKGALAASADRSSRSRLVQLSRRPALRGPIEDLTAKAASGPEATAAAVGLRLDVLQEQDRLDDLRTFLTSTAGASSSPEVLEAVEASALSHGFEGVQEQTRLRKIALATDPIERMQARLDLVHFYESHNNLAAAGRIVDDLYKTNPAVLGVVRAAADYYWRVKDTKRSVDVLAAAAGKAQPTYRDAFTLEAARKSTDAKDYQRARGFLAVLLQTEPYRSEYVSAMADTYGRQNDDKGLRDFYLERLKGAPVSQAAAIRRGLVPVLTRMKDYAGAVDQYIEVLNRFPEDADLAREVANYAAAHGRSEQLVAYYDRTRAKSPKDYRWPMVEARLQTHLENFPGAVASYQVAADLRPDRLDFYSERAGLEERLLRFEEAATTYSKLYDLSYHNSQWMVHVAEVRARLGQNDAAVKALDTALVAGHPTASAYFAVAEKLELWNLLPQARDYAEKGFAGVGQEYLSDHVLDTQTYARILTKAQAYQAVYQKLTALAGDKPVDSLIWEGMGNAVAQVFTPEEKVAFGAFALPNAEVLMPAIQKAGLLDLQAKALVAAKQIDSLVALQQRRLLFGELGSQLEAYWKSLPPEDGNRDSYLDLAAENYRLAGDSASELRIVSKRPGNPRYAELVARNSQQLDAALAATSPQPVRDSVANYVLAAGPAQKALQVVALRGRGETPLWTRAYTGLTGLYYAVNTPQVNDAFAQALGTGTIGERIGKQVDRNNQLAGDEWFYYGSRYGEYVGLTKQGDPEDYLPSGVEARPGSSDAYYQLAEYYRESGQAAPALEQYRYALQLDANRIDAHDRMASVLASQGKRDEAVAEFRAALAAASRQVNERHPGPSFPEQVQTTLEDIGKAKLLDPLRPDVDRMLRAYVRLNGNYRIAGPMHGLLALASDAAAGVSWMIEISKSAPDPGVFLGGEVDAVWVPDAQRGMIYRAMLDSARQRPEQADEMHNKEIAYASYLVDHKRGQDAAAILAAIPAEARSSRAGQILPLEALIAAQTSAMPAFIAKLTADTNARFDEVLQAASGLEKAGDHTASQQLREYVYTRQLASQEFGPSTFLGLAEIRLEQGNTDAAVALLKRMTMVTGEPFLSQMDAAALLTRMGHLKEAVPFLEERVKAVPWDVDARVRLAKAQGSAEALKAVAEAAGASYEARVQAARALGEMKAGPVAGPAELALLSSGLIAPAAAEKPYYYFARVDAASQTRDTAAKVRLLQGAIAIDPEPEASRLELIRAALAAKRWQLAASAAGTFQENTFFPALKRSDRVTLARGLAAAQEALSDLTAAMALYRFAGDTRDQSRLQAALDREIANAARRPVIKRDLTQDRWVRPRLVASAGNGGAR